MSNQQLRERAKPSITTSVSGVWTISSPNSELTCLAWRNSFFLFAEKTIDDTRVVQGKAFVTNGCKDDFVGSRCISFQAVDHKLIKKIFVFDVSWESVTLSKNTSSHQRCSVKKAVLKIFAIFTEKHLCWSLFYNLIKKKLQHRSFLSILQNF